MTDFKSKLEEIQKRCDLATPGPWVAHRTTKDDGDWFIAIDAPSFAIDGIYRPDYLWKHTGDAESNSWEDGDFVANARTDIPKLIKALNLAVEALRVAQERCQFTPGDCVMVKSYIREIERVFE